MSSYATVCASLASSADLAVSLSVVKPTPLDALLFACKMAQESYDDMVRRCVSFTEESREEWGFHLAVAADILDGTVSRPSTGNVREYALSLMS